MQGDQVMQGYWRNPAATEEAFAGGWFHTGDLARFDDEGYHYIVDRKKDMIITGGENVYSRQVEDVIYQQPAVVEVAVIGLPDEHWGENVCAVVVLEAGRDGHRGGDRAALPGQPRRLQEAQAGGVRRRAAQERQRQGPQARAAGAAVVTGSGRGREDPPMLLPDIIAFAARKHPDQPALFYEDTVVTFAELLSRLRRVANGLLSLASPGDRVAVLSENRAEYIDLYYGVPAAKMGLTLPELPAQPQGARRRSSTTPVPRCWSPRASTSTR